MKIHVMGRQDSFTFCLNEPWIHIGVYTPGDSEVPLHSNLLRVGVLQLAFHDVGRVSDCDWLGCQIGAANVVRFNEVHAKKILDFVKAHKVNHISVNCDAGACRSPAIAAALTKFWFDEDDLQYFKNHTPNYWVYRILGRVCND